MGVAFAGREGGGGRLVRGFGLVLAEGWGLACQWVWGAGRIGGVTYQAVFRFLRRGRRGVVWGGEG